jgi:hypothetical protein
LVVLLECAFIKKSDIYSKSLLLILIWEDAMNTSIQSFSHHAASKTIRLKERAGRYLLPAVSAGLAAFIMISAPFAQAADNGPKVYGKTIGDWGNAWWQWEEGFPSNPPATQTGNVDCSAGQTGKVWFLAGTVTDEPIERTCSIKKGKPLFFPLVNDIFWQPEDCNDEATCRAAAAPFIDSVTGWTCTIDNVPCVWHNQIVRDQSSPLPLNIVSDPFGAALGKRPMSISDGYWIMLDPLPLGEHTLHFTGDTPVFNIDVTYHLTVTK